MKRNLILAGGALLCTAFEAYRKTLGSRVTDADSVREQDREFFIAYAQTQRRKISEGAMRTQVTSNDHAPEDYRADTVRNLDAWYAAFDVKEGDAEYVKPDGTPNGEALFHGDFYDDMVNGVERVMSMGSILSSPVVAGDVV